MDATSTLVPVAAERLLGQVAELVDRLDDEGHTASSALFGASVGQHLRHALDHFAALMAGYEGESVVAYDRRDRGTAIETDRTAARAAAEASRAGVAGLDEVQLAFPVRVRVMVSGDGLESELDSTLGRELAFVTHHAIHHLAMIKSICKERGVELPEELGRAPSTLAHERG